MFSLIKNNLLNPYIKFNSNLIHNSRYQQDSSVLQALSLKSCISSGKAVVKTLREDQGDAKTPGQMTLLHIGVNLAANDQVLSKWKTFIQKVEASNDQEKLKALLNGLGELMPLWLNSVFYQEADGYIRGDKKEIFEFLTPERKKFIENYKKLTQEIEGVFQKEKSEFGTMSDEWERILLIKISIENKQIELEKFEKYLEITKENLRKTNIRIQKTESDIQDTLLAWENASEEDKKGWKEHQIDQEKDLESLKSKKSEYEKLINEGPEKIEKLKEELKTEKEQLEKIKNAKKLSAGTLTGKWKEIVENIGSNFLKFFVLEDQENYILECSLGLKILEQCIDSLDLITKTIQAAMPPENNKMTKEETPKRKEYLSKMLFYINNSFGLLKHLESTFKNSPVWQTRLNPQEKEGKTIQDLYEDLSKRFEEFNKKPPTTDGQFTPDIGNYTSLLKPEPNSLNDYFTVIHQTLLKVLHALSGEQSQFLKRPQLREDFVQEIAKSIPIVNPEPFVKREMDVLSH